MSDPCTNRELASVVTRLKGHAAKLGQYVVEDCQEAAGLLERQQRKIEALEKAVEAAYAEAETEQGEA